MMTETEVQRSTRTEPPLLGQTVVIIGGTSGIGLETARSARAAGAELIITGRDPGRLARAGEELNAMTTQLELGDVDALLRFFAGLPAAVDHVMVTGGGPVYAPIAELDFDLARQALDEHLLGSLRVARECLGRVRAGGSLTFITGTDARRPSVGSSIAGIAAAALPAITANAAVELAPIRVNTIAAGYVDTPLSARILGAELEQRRDQLRATLPIRRVVGPTDIAAMAISLMTNAAVTGATLDVDGGQQLLSG